MNSRKLFRFQSMGVILVAMSLMGLTGMSSYGALLLVEDFDKIAVGSIAGKSSWNGTTNALNPNSLNVVDTAPGSGTDHVLSSSTKSAWVSKTATTKVGVAENTVGTFYFQVYTTEATTGLSIGLTGSTASTFADYAAQMAFNNGISVYNGTTLKAVDNIEFKLDTWYNVWIVVDNANSQWSAYIQGGEITTATPLSFSGTTSFGFRNTTSVTLDTISIARGVGGTDNTAFVDDIYFGLGDHRGVVPVPEPRLLGLLGLGLLLLARKRRRSVL